jgi:hypothetical protein
VSDVTKLLDQLDRVAETVIPDRETTHLIVRLIDIALAQGVDLDRFRHLRRLGFTVPPDLYRCAAE